MTRKELENNRQFQITNAAIDYYYKYKDVKEIDIISIFEDACKWADKTMIDRACKYIEENFIDADEKGVIKSYSFDSVKEMFDNFKKAMEE